MGLTRLGLHGSALRLAEVDAVLQDGCPGLPSLPTLPASVVWRPLGA